MPKKERAAEVIFYEWGIQRWLTSRTRMALDAAGRNIYRELLDLCYAQGSIPKDPQVLMRHCAANQAEWDRAWPVILRHFHQHKTDSDSLVNDSATVFRKNYFQYCLQQKKNGKNGGTTKAKRASEIPSDGLPTGKKNPSDGLAKLKETKLKETNIPTPPTAYAVALKKASSEIHIRHPGAHRDISEAKVAKKLEAIVKFKKVPADERIDFIERINARHAELCASPQWKGEGGRYASGLRNWLAPTEERYEDPAPLLATPPTPRRLMF